VRVVHVINCLAMGGAERQLLRLAAAQRRAGDDVLIVTLLDKDTLRPEADRLGVPVRPLGLSAARGWRSALALPRTLRSLRTALRDFAPDVVQSWLYWANLASMLALGRNAERRPFPLAWNIRQTLPEVRGAEAAPRARTGAVPRERWAMRRAIALGARWSRRTDALVYNAETARAQHRAIGYGAAVEAVIPNAIAVDDAPHGPAARAAAREALGLPRQAPALAHAARLHPMKDHEGFLQACAPLLERRSDLVVVLFGRDVAAERFDEHISRLAPLRSALDARRLRFVGERLDLPSLLPAFDVVVSSSAWGEAFPNVVAEAMAAGVPVAATDVGDSREIVGETGVIVPPHDPPALANAVGSLLDRSPDDRAALGTAARARLAARCSPDAVLAAYHRLWSGLR